MASKSDKTKFKPLRFEPKDMLTLCTSMFVFSITLSTLLINFFGENEIAKTYAAIIILMVGLPFGLCAILASIALWRNSLGFWKLAKLALVLSYSLLFIIFVWIGISVFLGINLQAIASNFIPILGGIFVISFFVFGFWSELSRFDDAKKVMDAYFEIKTKVSHFDTIVYVRSNGIYLDEILLKGYETGQGFHPPAITGYRAISVSEKELEPSNMKKYVQERSVLLMIENKEIISKTVDIITKSGGYPVGCVLTSADAVLQSDLEEISKKLGIPVEAPK